MMAFPMMIVPAAEAAGILVPEDPENFDKEEFPHFAVFCALQLGKRMSPGEHWDNAKVIAGFTVEDLKQATVHDFAQAGFQI